MDDLPTLQTGAAELRRLRSAYGAKEDGRIMASGITTLIAEIEDMLAELRADRSAGPEEPLAGS